MLVITGCSLSACIQMQRTDMRIYQDYMRPPQKPTEAGKGIHVTHFGTTTLLFDDGETQVMIDSFFTRPTDWGQLFLGEIRTDQKLIDRLLSEHQIDRLKAIMVFHSHYDHAMDIGAVAQGTGAQILGSESTANIARGADIPEAQIQVITPGKAYHFGKFEVTFLVSKHTHLPFLIEAMGMMGDISEPLHQPSSMFTYKVGETYAIQIKHPLGTSLLKGAAFIPGELKGYTADTIFLCTPGLDQLSPAEKQQFFQEMLVDTQAKKIIPVHWDDFSTPLETHLTPMPKSADDLEDSLGFVFDGLKNHPEMTLEFIPALEPLLLFKADEAAKLTR